MAGREEGEAGANRRELMKGQCAGWEKKNWVRKRGSKKENESQIGRGGSGVAQLFFNNTLPFFYNNLQLL